MSDEATMVLKADLQCSKCYKKVKKVLCKFPEIRDQVYDEKQNAVTIKVVCCCPEKLREKICCKGDGAIKSIEIKSTKKPPDPEKKPKDKPADKLLVEFVNLPKSPPKVPIPVPVPVPAPCYPPYYPFGVCCPGCYEGCSRGPCYHDGGPPRCCDGCGKPVCDSWCSSRPYYRCHNVYFCEENSSGCTIT